MTLLSLGSNELLHPHGARVRTRWRSLLAGLDADARRRYLALPGMVMCSRFHSITEPAPAGPSTWDEAQRLSVVNAPLGTS